MEGQWIKGDSVTFQSHRKHIYLLFETKSKDISSPGSISRSKAASL